MDLRNLKRVKKLEEILPFDEIERCYNVMTKILNHDTRAGQEATKTKKEVSVLKRIKEKTKLRSYDSFWIGSRNIDIFIPCLRGERCSFGGQSSGPFNGLAIEVDGDVHNSQLKMNRDNSKYDLLKRLRIAVYVIENGDLQEETFKSFLRQISTLPRLDSRAKKRVMRNVYLATLVKQRNKVSLEHLLRPDQIETLKQIHSLL